MPRRLTIFAFVVVFCMSPQAGNGSAAGRQLNGRGDEILLERNGGYPLGVWYTVSIRKNGDVIWYGKEAVRVKGRVRSRIEKSSAENLFEMVRAMNFFSAEEMPMEGCVTDGPWEAITVKDGPRSRRLSSEACVDLPKGFNEWADEIDRAAHTIQWIFTDASTLEDLLRRGRVRIAKDGQYYMEGAIERDDRYIIGVLAKYGFDVNSNASSGETYLMKAVMRNKFTSAEALLLAGAAPTARNGPSKETPAINAGGHGVRMIKLFLDRNVPVNDADANGWTMLMKAVLQGDVEAVRLIVQAEANINARNVKGETAIGVAEENRDKDHNPKYREELNVIIDYFRQRGGVK